MAKCTHSIADKNTAIESIIANSLCPLCLQAEVERLKKLLRKSIPLLKSGWHGLGDSKNAPKRDKLVEQIEQALKELHNEH